MAERVSVHYNGFEISVLPLSEYGPPLRDPKYWYSAYICRSGETESREGGKKFLFSQALPTFPNEADALAAGLKRAKSIVDGNDPLHSVKHL
ncbi:hypothetical protein V8G57_02760 [Collimonas sp. H4R21]|uniref:Uncharacterized protein n=1 Tax=Collimonas rhizosphaerae TaxID=3126357 RepID=A0ABU9PQL7_9BURK